MSAHFHVSPIHRQPAVLPGAAARDDAPAGGKDAFAALLSLAGGGSAPDAPSAAPAPSADASATTAAPSPLKAAAKDLLDALKQLKTALDQGTAPDANLKTRIEADIEALSGDHPAKKPELGQAVGAVGAVAGLAAAAFAPALAPLVGLVTHALEHAADTPAAPATAVSSQSLGSLKDKLLAFAERVGPQNGPLAAKLEQLAGQLGGGKLSPEALQALGLDDNAPDPEARQVLQALLAKPQAPAGAIVAGDRTPFTPAHLDLPDGTTFSARRGGLDATAAPAHPPDADDRTRPTLRVEPPPNAADARTEHGAADHGASFATVIAAAAHRDNAERAPATGGTPTPVQSVAAPNATGAPKPLPAAYQTPQVNLPQLAFEIARQAQQGTSRFQIRLDPPELGRIDVHMNVDSGGNLNARLTVERTETLDLLQRDHRGLERALAQSGLDTAKTNLEFSLRQGPFDRPQGGPLAFMSDAGAAPVETASDTAPSIVTLYRGTASAGGLNIFV